MFTLKSSKGTHSVQESKDSSYSTAEVSTGTTWVDGKTIYKKTFAYNNTALSNSFNKAHGISNVYRVIDVKAVLIADDGGSIQFPDLTSSGKGLKFDGNTTSIYGRGNDTWSAQATRTLYVTLYYTKTS